MTPDEKRAAEIEARVKATFVDGIGSISESDFKELCASRLAWRFTAKCFSVPNQADLEQEALEGAIERMGWPEIHAFQDEMRKGQSIFEDAGSYMMRCIRRLFGLPQIDEEIITYQRAAKVMADKAAHD